MGDRLGIPGAVSFCFSFTGQLTHFSKLQHSCVLLYPFNLIAAFFCLLTSLWLLSAFGVTKDSSASRSSFLLQGAIDRLFCQLRGRCTLLDFKFKFQEFKRTKQILKFTFFWCWWLVKITCKWTNQIFSFFSYFVGTWKQDKRFISSKKFNEITIKVRANIYIYYLLFIYLLFIYLLFIYLFIYLLFFFRHGLSVFFIIQN